MAGATEMGHRFLERHKMEGRDLFLVLPIKKRN